MTCIVGITNGETVVIGGDSLGTSGWDATARRDPKVWAHHGMAFGFTTSFRMGQLLRWRLTPPDHPEGMDTDEYMATLFIDAVRQCLAVGGWTKTENSRDEGGNFLVGYRGRLFEVGSDFQVGESLDGYAAVGAGFAYALGSLCSATRPDLQMAAGDPIELRRHVDDALRAAEHHCAAVRGPFRYASTSGNNDQGDVAAMLNVLTAPRRDPCNRPLTSGVILTEKCECGHVWLARSSEGCGICRPA